jgi:hypothetical protein
MKANNIILESFDGPRPGQIYTTGLEYCFVTPTEDKNKFRQSHQFILCKDFLHDAVWAMINKTSTEIYGFIFNSEKQTINLDKTILAIRDNTKESRVIRKESTNTAILLRKVERLMKFKRTTLLEANTGDPKVPAFILTSDKRWMHAAPLLSLYSLLIRIGVNYDRKTNPVEFILNIGKGPYSNDMRYVTSIKNILSGVIKNNISLFNKDMSDNYPKDTNVNTLHNHFGVVHYAEKCNSGPHVVSGWKSPDKPAEIKKNKE